MKQDQREAVKEGDTYAGEIEVQAHIDTETIPSKKRLTREESDRFRDDRYYGLQFILVHNMITYHDLIG